mgnify:CR=1 FL=1
MFKKLAIVLVALVAFGGTVSAYAWWDTLQTEQTGQTLTIGEGTVLTVAANPSAELGKNLVPDEALLGVNDVKSYTLKKYEEIIDQYSDKPSPLLKGTGNIPIVKKMVL